MHSFLFLFFFWCAPKEKLLLNNHLWYQVKVPENSCVIITQNYYGFQQICVLGSDEQCKCILLNRVCRNPCSCYISFVMKLLMSEHCLCTILIPPKLTVLFTATLTIPNICWSSIASGIPCLCSSNTDDFSHYRKAWLKHYFAPFLKI